MRFAVITYDYPHLKTEQLLLGLHEKGHDPLDVFALPFVPRKGRDVAFAHRPDMASGAHPREVSAALGHSYTPVKSAEEIPTDFDVMIVGGAGILPEALVSKVKIINAHAGLIPCVRGLDSFKWAIYDGMPLGVTLHLIDANVDAGEVLGSVRTPVFTTDTIEDVARRHYELEMMLLTNYRHYIDAPQGPNPELVERPARMRMPIDVEREMFDKFDVYKDLHCGH